MRVFACLHVCVCACGAELGGALHRAQHTRVCVCVLCRCVCVSVRACVWWKASDEHKLTLNRGEAGGRQRGRREGGPVSATTVQHLPRARTHAHTQTYTHTHTHTHTHSIFTHSHTCKPSTTQASTHTPHTHLTHTRSHTCTCTHTSHTSSTHTSRTHTPPPPPPPPFTASLHPHPTPDPPPAETWGVSSYSAVQILSCSLQATRASSPVIFTGDVSATDLQSCGFHIGRRAVVFLTSASKFNNIWLCSIYIHVS